MRAVYVGAMSAMVNFVSSASFDCQHPVPGFNSSIVVNLTRLPFPQTPRWNFAFGALRAFGLLFGANAKYIDDFLARICPSCLPGSYPC